MAFTAKMDHVIMEKLGVTELRHYIADTNKGTLTLMIRKGESSYHLVLDAVPLLPELDKEMMALLFPLKELPIPQVNKSVLPKGATVTGTKPIDMSKATSTLPKKGRPKGSKNR